MELVEPRNRLQVFLSLPRPGAHPCERDIECWKYVGRDSFGRNVYVCNDCNYLDIMPTRLCPDRASAHAAGAVAAKARAHGHMTEFTPEFVWRLNDTALFTRLPAGGCRAARDPKPISYPRADDIAQECTLPFEPANDIVAIGFCNCARIHLHGNMGGRRYEVLCRDENSDSRSPPTP
jgi:hypothetical protein